jgi:ABC-type oligopeptide transport system ATPase subunit
MRNGEIVERIDDVAGLSPDTVEHPYTKQLLAATPVVTVPTESTRTEQAEAHA